MICINHIETKLGEPKLRSKKVIPSEMFSLRHAKKE